MKGSKVGYKEQFMKRVEPGKRAATGRPVRDRIEVEIKTPIWISSSERILNSSSPLNKCNARIPVPDFA
ncbi:MAG: hypothetical protein JW913_18675 [Chitinispirillaceae bacterium]|nr:hypothetical protein [Chitinispirillaceae bacterium]